MLKTNSKKASENLKAYITRNASGENIGICFDDMKFEEIAKTIYGEFTQAKWSCKNDYLYYKTEQNAFEAWASGLPSVLDTCYYYNRSAVDDLGAILEQTETEKAKYSEQESEKLLTYLIYREIKKAA